MIAHMSNVGKQYGGKSVLSDLTMTLAAGEFVALLGENGAGKTTTINILLGLTKPSEGRATLFGQPPEKPEARHKLGVILQNEQLPGLLTVNELINQVRHYYPKSRTVQECATLAGITPLLASQYQKLSGGQKRSVQFAMAISGYPELLVLDEPTAGMDVHARQALWAHLKALKAQGVSLLLTTHYIEEAEALADRIMILRRGRIIHEDYVSNIVGLRSTKIITCNTQIPLDDLVRHDKIIEVSVNDDIARIVTIESDDVLRYLFANDPNISGVDVRHTGVSELFMNLTENVHNVDA